MIHSIAKYFDKLEDRVRVALSHHLISYSLIGGIGVVLFWRGVWITADDIFYVILPEKYMIWSGPISIIVSVLILLLSGLFVSFFITDRIILSGLKRERKLAEKTEEEVRQERDLLTEVAIGLASLTEEVQDLKKKIQK